jgi:hypothetical protein
MSIRIEIHVPDHDPVGNRIDKRALLTEDMAALGFERQTAAPAALYVDETASEQIVANIAEKLAETAPGETATEEPKRRGRRPKTDAAPAAATPQISTGGERVGPEDSPEDAAQDAADEAAEVEANRDPKKPLTIDDVRAAVTAYVNTYGMPAAQEDGPKIFVEALGNPPADEPYWKMSLLPDDQERLAKVVDAWEKAIAEPPVKRAKVSS